MKKNGILNRMKGILGTLSGANRFGREDFVLLKTALMLAAVDGEIDTDEVARFRDLAEHCRGYCGKSFDALWERALRSAGYLLVQTHFLTKEELAKAFVKEAESDFVGTVVFETSDERTRAFELLETMAKADGVYSDAERACLDALTERVREVRARILSERYPHAVVFDS